MANVEMEKIADVIYEAPFAVMTHDRFSEGVKDEESVFTYGNKACGRRSSCSNCALVLWQSFLP
jgi:hypothetical protein